MNYGRYEFLEFDLKSMKDDPSIVMIAKRGSGKSFLVRDIVYHYRRMPAGAVMAPTDRMNPFFKKFFPDLYVHYEISTEIIAKILKRQVKMDDKFKKAKKEGRKINPRAILVMDDCLAKKKSWQKDESIMEVLMNGRHYKLTYILTMQTPIGVGPDLRLNFDYIFLLKEDSNINLKKLYENYASMFPSLPAFKHTFAKCTENYGSMVIDNRKPSDRLDEKVFWFKAKNRKFSFGSQDFINLHKRYYDKDYRKKIFRSDNNALFGSKSKCDIKIDLKGAY